MPSGVPARPRLSKASWANEMAGFGTPTEVNGISSSNSLRDLEGGSGRGKVPRLCYLPRVSPTVSPPELRRLRRRLRVARWVIAFAASVLSLGLLGSTWARSPESDLLARLAVIEATCQQVCGAAPDFEAIRSRVEALAGELKALHGAADGGEVTLAVLNGFVFEFHGIKASQDLHDPRNLLLSRVLDRKQGYCVGIAALYLVLAERLGLPIFAVATPSHVFLRYDDGTTRSTSRLSKMAPTSPMGSTSGSRGSPRPLSGAASSCAT